MHFSHCGQRNYIEKRNLIFRLIKRSKRSLHFLLLLAKCRTAKWFCCFHLVHVLFISRHCVAKKLIFCKLCLMILRFCLFVKITNCFSQFCDILFNVFSSYAVAYRFNRTWLHFIKFKTYSRHHLTSGILALSEKKNKCCVGNISFVKSKILPLFCEYVFVTGFFVFKLKQAKLGSLRTSLSKLDRIL